MRGNLLISYFISFLLLGILGACRDENPEEKGRDRGPGKYYSKVKSTSFT